MGAARTSQVLRQGSNASDAVPFVHRILGVLSLDVGNIKLEKALGAVSVTVGLAPDPYVREPAGTHVLGFVDVA